MPGKDLDESEVNKLMNGISSSDLNGDQRLKLERSGLCLILIHIKADMYIYDLISSLLSEKKKKLKEISK